MIETRVSFAAKIDKEGRNCQGKPPQGIHLDGR